MKTHRVRKVLLIVAAVWLTIMARSWVDAALERYWPMSQPLPNVPLQDLAVLDRTLGEDPWTRPQEGIRLIQWTNRLRSIPGRVTLEKWSVSGRTYYQLRGPVNPGYGQTSPRYIVSQVYLLGEHGIERWDLFVSQDGHVVHEGWMNQARKQIAKRQLCGEYAEDYLTVSFWVPPGRIVGNIVFHYQEEQFIAWVATEQAGTKNHDNFLRWEKP